MNFINDFQNEFNSAWLKKHILALYELERKQNFTAYKQAAEYTYTLLKDEGFDAELLAFPADGKTVYQDKTCPIGWKVSDMRLELLSEVAGIENPMLADYQKEPLTCAKHSVSTPPEGITAHVITENQLKTGEYAEGAFVLLNPSTRPTMPIIRLLLDLGAIGWISDFQEEGLTEDIDSVYWCNAATENGSWSTLADERDFIGYQISPRQAHFLRAACEQSIVYVKAFSDAKRIETEQYAVTGLLPGEDKREIWILSHTCEPLIDDNPNGVIGSIAILKALRKFAEAGKIKLKYSIRLVFASEMYGMSAVAEHFGGNLSKRCIGAINTDGTEATIRGAAFREINPTEAPDLPGFVGNIFMQEVCRHIQEACPDLTIHYHDHRYADDCFLSDTTVGLPTLWFRHTHRGYHHHSSQDPTILCMEGLIEHLSIHADLLRYMAGVTEEEIREMLPRCITRANGTLEKAAKQNVRAGTDLIARLRFIQNREQEKLRGFSLYTSMPEVEAACAAIVLPKAENDEIEQAHRWYDYAQGFVFSRSRIGFPHDLANLPPEKRRILPGDVTYCDFADVLSRMDGQKTFKDILDEIEWDMGKIFSEYEIFVYLNTCIYLAEAKHLGMHVKKALTQKDITDALHALGVTAGETLLVHTSLTQLGYVQGGADTIIDALKQTVGEDGTFLAPAFLRPFIYSDGCLNKSNEYRPYDTRPDGALRDKAIWTGALPKTMLKRNESFRSGHISHEWTAIGKNAEYCTSGHALLDSPCGKNSPLAKALELDGSVVFIGCSIGANTFIHYIEAMANAPFLNTALATYIDENGNQKTGRLTEFPGGCRSFYTGADSYFYKEAVRRGLHIDEAELGIGKLYKIRLRELYEIGMQMHKEDPYAMLCGDENCVFCKQHKKLKK